MNSTSTTISKYLKKLQTTSYKLIKSKSIYFAVFPFPFFQSKEIFSPHTPPLPACIQTLWPLVIINVYAKLLFSISREAFPRLLTARPWAKRGSRFTLDLFLFFLTARPWAKRGS